MSRMSMSIMGCGDVTSPTESQTLMQKGPDRELNPGPPPIKFDHPKEESCD